MATRKGMRAAPLSRYTVTGVMAVMSVPHMLGVPDAQPAAASVGARLGRWVRTSFKLIAESFFSVRGLCDLISPVQIFGAPEILCLNFGMRSKKHGFFRVCGHRPRF